MKEIIINDKGFEIIGRYKEAQTIHNSETVFLMLEYENCYPISETGYRSVAGIPYDHEPKPSEIENIIREVYKKQERVEIKPKSLFEDSEIAQEYPEEEEEENEPLEVSFPCDRCQKTINAIEYGEKNNRWYDDCPNIGKGNQIISICFTCYKKALKKDPTLDQAFDNYAQICCWDIEDKIEELKQTDTSDANYDPVFDPTSNEYFENMTTEEWYEYQNKVEKEKNDKQEKTHWEYDPKTGEQQQTLIPKEPKSDKGEFIGDLFSYDE